MSRKEKPLEFHGTSRKDLISFPADIRQDAGFQLGKVQNGEDPDDWKPFHTVGSGVKEIRVEEENNTFRVIFVAKFEDAVHVLHAFQKKSRQTKKADIDIAKERYKALVRERAKRR